MTGSRPSTPSYDRDGAPPLFGNRTKFGLNEELFRPPSRSNSPAREYGRSDHLAPREAGLPLFLPSHSSSNQQSNLEDTNNNNNTNRRRTGANNDRTSYYDDSMMRRGRTSNNLNNSNNNNHIHHHLEPLEIDNETTYDDGGKGEKQGGYAMESMYTPSNNNLNGGSGTREFSAESTKWDRLIPEKREPETWVNIILNLNT